MWVAFIMNDPHGGAEYYGQISRSDFDSLVGGSFEGGFIKFENLSWMDESEAKLHKFSKFENFGYLDEGFFRAEHIVRIIPVRDDFMTQHTQAD